MIDPQKWSLFSKKVNIHPRLVNLPHKLLYTPWQTEREIYLLLLTILSAFSSSWGFVDTFWSCGSPARSFVWQTLRLGFRSWLRSVWSDSKDLGRWCWRRVPRDKPQAGAAVGKSGLFFHLFFPWPSHIMRNGRNSFRQRSCAVGEPRGG